MAELNLRLRAEPSPVEVTLSPPEVIEKGSPGGLRSGPLTHARDKPPVRARVVSRKLPGVPLPEDSVPI